MELRKLNWSDCSVVQYLEIQDLLNEEELTSTDLVLEVADLFWDLDEEVDEDLLDDLTTYTSFIFNHCKPKAREEIKVGGREFQLKKFSKLPLSAFIDLDITLVKNSLEDCIVPVSCVLYEGLEECAEFIKEARVTDIIGCIIDYIEYRKSVFRKYPNIFGDPDEEELDEEELQELLEEDEEFEEEEEIDPAEAWMKTVFGLAGGDITKYPNVVDKPHILVFNWVTMAESVAVKSGPQPSTE